MNAARKEDARVENDREIVVTDYNGDQTRIEFDKKIEKIVKFDKIVICLLDSRQSDDMSNVYGYKYSGELAWRIEPANTPGPSPRPWMGIAEEPTLRVADWYGMTLFISPYTGKVLDRYWAK